jgi:hypothetical protein
MQRRLPSFCCLLFAITDATKRAQAAGRRRTSLTSSSRSSTRQQQQQLTSLPVLPLLTLTFGLSSDALKWLEPTDVSSVTTSCSADSKGMVWDQNRQAGNTGRRADAQTRRLARVEANAAQLGVRSRGRGATHHDFAAGFAPAWYGRAPLHMITCTQVTRRGRMGLVSS